MRIAVTGADGFLGWHTRCALRALNVDDVVPINSAVIADPTSLDAALRDVDAVVHLAGINRADDSELRHGNAALASSMTASLDRVGRHPTIVYADSIQAGNGSAYGDGKLAAAEILTAWGSAIGTAVIDVRLPNIFGEHGRPHYNSVIATFCHELAHGGSPAVIEDRTITLLHAQDAVDNLIDAIGTPRSATVEPPGRAVAVSAILATLQSMRETYQSGEIPDVADPFDMSLFNTYRSFCFPDAYPIRSTMHTDYRGSFFEVARAAGGESQVSCSMTMPGISRGNHFHRRKVERFEVIRGTAVIELRKVLGNDVISFAVSGDEPAAIDMPTLWSHSITNTGTDELITLFWAADLFDPENPDTYADPVRRVEAAP